MTSKSTRSHDDGSLTLTSVPPAAALDKPEAELRGRSDTNGIGTYEALLGKYQALERSEAALRDFVDTSTIGLHWVGADGTILWANQAELDLLGYTRDEYIGRSISDFHADEFVIKDILTCLTRGDTLRDYPARLLHRDGSIRHVLINSSVVFEEGKFVHTRCFTRDVTGQKEMEHRYHTLFEALPAAVYTTDAVGRLTSFNRAAVEFSGRVPTLLSDLWCVSWKLYWPDGTPMPHDQCPMALALKQGCPVRGYEAIAERPDGTRRNFISFPTPLYDASGKLTGAVNMLVDITDRKRAENALRESEELLRAIFTSSAVGVAVLTTDARFLQVNQSFCSISGYSEAELLTLDCSALTHPDDCLPMREQISQLLSGAIQSFVIEKRYCRKDGEMIWVQNSVSMTRDHENRPANIIALCQNITERKRSEAALCASQAESAAELSDTKLLRDISAQLIELGDEQALYAKIVDAAAAIMRSDFATVQMFYPDRGPKGQLHLLASRGLNAEAQKLWEWVRFDTDSTCGQAFRTGKRAIAPNVETTDFLSGTSGGAALLAAGIRAAQSTPLYSRSGSFIGMISTHWRQPHSPTERDLRLLDILARQAADLIEREQGERIRAQLSAIVESSGDAIYAYDFDGKILTWNAAAEQLYGYRANEIVGRSVEEVVPPEARAELRELINPGVNAGKMIRDLETRRMRRDGSVFPAMLTVSPIRDDAGEVVALSVIARDITARKRAEDELRSANQDLEQFAYSASHDLQEPLRTIKIYSELLAGHCGDSLDGEPALYFEFLRSAATRMEMLIRDLLTYTQVHKRPAPDVETDASKALQDALADLRGAVEECGAGITFDLLPAVRIDEPHLRQLFQNLLGNAVKYRSPDRPCAVHVSAKRQDGFWIFSVRDNGIGIEEQYREQIFGLFTRIHSAGPGTGIGLAICQRIVGRYHGRIWVESEPGKGSDFHFALPV